MIPDLIATYGTPLWIYDAPTIRQRIADLAPFDIIRYAQKACSNTHILGLMHACGVKVDAVSKGEIIRAIHAGYTPADIVFTADLMDRETLDFVIANGITVNAGSIDMLHQLGAQNPGHPVWLRINPGFGHGHSTKTNTGGETSKHGIWHHDAPAALAAIAHFGLRLKGVHMHIGSGVDYDHLAQVCDAMVDFIVRYAIDVPAISAGGGLSVPYQAHETPVDITHYHTLWDTARRKLAAHLGHDVKLEIEPGRYLVAEAGTLWAEVRAVKDMGSLHYILADAGFTELVRPAMYGSYHDITVHAPDGRQKSAPTYPAVVAGPLCESGDVFTQAAGGEMLTRPLPRADIGDYIVFKTAGAYGASMSSNYNSRPYCAEILVDGDTARLIRRRQTMDELLALESV
ncbi:MAG: diaminopimelate decarboxylase [Pseudomonadota bacterium]